MVLFRAEQQGKPLFSYPIDDGCRGDHWGCWRCFEWLRVVQTSGGGMKDYRQAPLLSGEYLDAVIDDDVYRIDGAKRDVPLRSSWVRIRLLLRKTCRRSKTRSKQT